MNSGSRCDERFLIIAGAIKAGTTSLFHYFAGHPQINPCRVKEPWFFLPPGTPEPTRPRWATDTLDDYLALFTSPGPGKTKLEGSAVYFGIEGTGELIASVLPNSRVVVSMREPVARLISQYQMASFHGWLPRKLSLDAWVEQMIDRLGQSGVEPIYRYPLLEGRYAARLRRWRTAFGDRLLTVWFNEITASPLNIARRIAAFANLDASYFDQLEFGRENRARAIRGAGLREAYSSFGEQLRSRLDRDSATFRVLGKIRKRLEPALDRLTIVPAPRLQPRPSTLRLLRDFYAGDAEELCELTGQRPPWTAATKSDITA